MKVKQSSDNLTNRKRVGIFLGEVSPYSDMIWQGIVDGARELHVNTISLIGRELAHDVESHSTDNIIYQLANQDSLDGLIILTSGLGSLILHAEIEAFSQQYRALLPTVCIGEKVKGIPSLTIENKTGLRDLLSHLILDHGYRKIAFMKGPQDSFEAQERYKAYREILAAENLPFDPNLVVQGGFVTLSGQTACKELLYRGVDFDVLVAANDWTAWGAVEVFKAHGLNVPGDFAVVGFDDSVDSQYFMPPLTTVKQPRYELGQQAIKMLWACLQGSEIAPEKILPTEIVIRESCGCRSLIAQYMQPQLEFQPKGNSEKIAEKFSEMQPDLRKKLSAKLGTIPAANEWVQASALALFDAAISDFEEAQPQAFLSTLDQILRQAITEQSDIILWQDLLSLIRQHILDTKIEKDVLLKLETLWQQARILLSNLAQQALVQQRSKADLQSRMLFEISQNVISTFDLENLFDTLPSALHQLNISYCFLCLNDGLTAQKSLENLPAWSQLVFAYVGGKKVELQPGGIRYETRQILPDRFWQHRQRYDWAIMPLRFQQLYLGYAIFDMAINKGLIYDALQIQISSAIQGALLIKQLNQAQEDLESRVEERTAELQNEISERKLAEQSLRANEQRYRVLFEQTNDAVFILNFNQTILMTNQKAADLLGYKIEEMASLGAKDIVVADEIPDANQKLQLAMTGEPPPIYERHLIRKDGSLVPVEINISQVSDSDGNPLHIQSVIRDITERKRSEHVIQALNAASFAMRQAITSRDVFEAIGSELKARGFGCTIFRTNHDLSQILPQYFNYESKGIVAAEKLLNTKIEDFSFSSKAVATFRKTILDQETVFDDDVGTSISQLLPQPVQGFGQQIMRLLNVQRAINAPLVVDQQMMGMFSIQSDELTTEDIPTVTAFAHQIAATWQKARLMQDLELSLVAQLQTEESLRESEEKYRTLFDLSPEAIVLIGLNGIILDANKAATGFGDITKEDIIGKSFLDIGIFDESRSQYFLELFSELIIGDISGPLEFQLILRENALHWIEAHPALLKDGDEVLALQLILRDVTDRKDAEQAIQQRVDELEVIHQTSLKLANASLSINEIAEIAVQQLSNVMEADTCAFSMLDLNGRELTVVAHLSNEGQVKKLLGQGETISFDDYPIAERTLKTTIPLTIYADDPDAASAERTYLRENNIAMLMIIPLSVKSRVIGMLELALSDKRHHVPSQINLAMTLANQIAVALDNARLFESAQQEIFDRIQAEMALQESEEQFRSIFENAVMGFYRSTPGGKILMANPALIRMLGFQSFSELAERDLKTDGFTEEVPRSEFMYQMQTKGQVIGLEATWIRKDNTPLYVQESAKAIVDNNGKVIFYEGTVEDISQRKQIEALQRISEERFNKAFNISPLAMGIQGAEGDERGVWLLINDAFSQVTGYSRAEVLGHTNQELKIYAHAEEREEATKLFLRQGFISEFEFEFRKKSGECRHGLLWSENTEVGEERNILVLIQDVTDRKKAERERQTLIDFQQIVAMLSARFINLSTIEIEEEITYALKIIAEYAQADAGSVWMFSDDKSTGSKTFGWPTLGKRQRNQNILLSKYGWMFEQLLEGKMISISGKADYPSDARQMFADFDLSAILAIPLITEGDVIGSLSIYIREAEKNWSDELESLLKIIGDIIVNALERKRAEENIRQLNEELELRVIQRTQQLEAANKELEAFAYSVSHDLRAPLRAIDGFSLALIEDYNDQLDDDAQNYLRRVRVASQRMGQLIDDLLKLSRVTRSEMVHNDVNLSTLVTIIVDEFRETEPDRNVIVTIQPDLLTLGDAHLLRIMLTNLYGNAWKFTRKEEQAQIEFGCLNEEEPPTFFIRDNGAGFDMTYADKLFGTFQRLHTIRDFEGTGIGLATVKRIIQRHGGRVWAESEVDCGATFYFTIGEIP